MIYFIMPVGSDRDFETKRLTLERLLLGAGAVCHSPLESAGGPALEPESALREMRMATVIIADLALERPSCYFEVGLAQGAGLHVDLIAPKGTTIHQVGGRDGVIFYDSGESYELVVERLLRYET